MSNNILPAADLPRLIASTHATLRSLSDMSPSTPLETGPLTAAVPIKRSVTPDPIVCLECGKSFTSIKRHLAKVHDLAPEQYRSKWNLPQGYPTVTPNYSTRRSALAKENGLGRDRGRRAAG